VDHGQLSRFVRGERTLTLPVAARVCEALGPELVKKTGAGAAQKAKSRRRLRNG
jgi:hypothetical protein